MDEYMKTASLSFKNAMHDNALIKLGIEKCSKALTAQRNNLRFAKNVGAKHQITSNIIELKSYRTQLKAQQLTTGAGSSRNTNRANWSSNRVKWEEVESAFSGRVLTGVIINLAHKDPKNFLSDSCKKFCSKIKETLKKEPFLKVNTIFCGRFQVARTEETIHELKYMNTKNFPIYQETDLNVWFKEHAQEEILKKVEEFQEKDSGWSLSAVINLTVNINKFNPQLGSSYIPLPKQIALKKACINVKNADDKCFAWAITSALHPTKKNPHRLENYTEYFSELNLDGIKFPMTIKQVPRFEKQNDVSVNVYILRKKEEIFDAVPTYLTKDKKERHVNVLMVQSVYYNENGDVENDARCNEAPIEYHYVWIKNLSRLLSSQLSKHNQAKYFCDRCLHYFNSSARLEQHTEDCSKLNHCKIRMPTEQEKIINFKNYKNKVMNPFVVYADLECILEKTNSELKKTTTFQNHKPCSVGFFVNCAYDPKRSFYKSYRGGDCIDWFVRELYQFAAYVEKLFLCPLPMAISEEQIRNFEIASECHICNKPFIDGNIKAKDHCHLTGTYRGPAHEGCNVNFKDSPTIPIVFHNLSGYDSHFIIKNLATDIEGRIDLLPINKERYISFTKCLNQCKIKFRFIDSFRFMDSSLDTLSSHLTSFPLLKSQFGNLSDNQFNLLTKKGVFPYDYCDSFSKFSDVSLPDIKEFSNKLNESNIEEDQYVHAQKVWHEFNVTNLGEYSDIYLKTDVLLLADVFEKFRSSCHKTYGLDPAHYFTLPGYTWDAMLRYTNIDLELLTDVDMLMFVERGIRGGLSQCSKRYAMANNKYMPAFDPNHPRKPSFDPTQPSKYLMYYDINNQYGWAMSQCLPCGGFSWVNDFKNFSVLDVPDDSPIGYILEVDLDYPAELHNHHKDLPFCPEHAIPKGSKQKKLMATLDGKTKYIIHYRNLKQALRNGLKLTKIHRALKFRQTSWLKSYIDLNTELRTAAKNDFEKNLFKLMNNAVFGKTMENIRKYSIVKLVTKWLGRYGAEALISKPEFKARTIFNENLVAIELNKSEIFFNKPIYVGMCVLDLAKTTIYDFHYGYMAPQFGTDCSICYTDTDSLIYEITCPDIYQIIKRDCATYFDTSDYPCDNVWGIPHVNKKVLGLMKDENKGKIMTGFVGLRSKMYAIKVEGEDDIKKSKGVKRNIMKKEIKFDDYVYCLENNTKKSIKQNFIHSQKHDVSSITQEKVALSPDDDKRNLIENSYETLPWGHFSIMDVE